MATYFVLLSWMCSLVLWYKTNVQPVVLLSLTLTPLALASTTRRRTHHPTHRAAVARLQPDRGS
eukprot:3410470-Rhodomonas_salina.1